MHLNNKMPRDCQQYCQDQGAAIRPEHEYENAKAHTNEPVQGGLSFQRCSFVSRNSTKDVLGEKDFKTIFRGKAIVQPAKPFCLNSRFQDL